MVAGDFHGVGDDLFKRRRFHAFFALAVELPDHVHIADAFVLRQHAKRGGVRGQLVIGVGEIRIVLVFQRHHGIQLPAHFGLDLRLQIGEERGGVAGQFAQHQQHGALHIVAVFQRAVGLGGDAQAAVTCRPLAHRINARSAQTLAS